jgi:nickel-dependent lactate racemase
MDVTLKKGRHELKFSVPDEKVAAVLTGNDVAPIDLEKAKRSVYDGVKKHSPDNIAELKTAIIVPDDTRLWARGDLFVPQIVRALTDLGVAGRQIKIIIALGTHNDMEAAVFPQLVGSLDNVEIDIINSANRDRERLVHLGKTGRNTGVSLTKEAVEAENIIIFGGVLHHMFAGYGGGRKYIFPGIAGYDSIQQNHSLAMRQDGMPHPMVQSAILDGNPLNEDLTEAANLFLKDRSSLYVAVAANGAGQIFHAGTGPVHETFIDSCRELDRACRVDIAKKADFALISAGGYRTDGQLYQATKALCNGVGGVKEGGDILFVAECGQGIGSPVFASVLRDHRDDPRKFGKELIQNFNMPVCVAFRVMTLLKKYRVTLVSGLQKSDVESLGFYHLDDIEDYVRNLKGTGYIMPFAENVLPVCKG